MKEFRTKCKELFRAIILGRGKELERVFRLSLDSIISMLRIALWKTMKMRRPLRTG